MVWNKAINVANIEIELKGLTQQLNKQPEVNGNVNMQDLIKIVEAYQGLEKNIAEKAKIMRDMLGK